MWLWTSWTGTELWWVQASVGQTYRVREVLQVQCSASSFNALLRHVEGLWYQTLSTIASEITRKVGCWFKCCKSVSWVNAAGDFHFFEDHPKILETHIWVRLCVGRSGVICCSRSKAIRQIGMCGHRLVEYSKTLHILAEKNWLSLQCICHGDFA